MLEKIYNAFVIMGCLSAMSGFFLGFTYYFGDDKFDPLFIFISAGVSIISLTFALVTARVIIKRRK